MEDNDKEMGLIAHELEQLMQRIEKLPAHPFLMEARALLNNGLGCVERARCSIAQSEQMQADVAAPERSGD